MSRPPSTFRQGDITRAVKGAVAAGLPVQRVEIDAAGKIVIVSKNADSGSDAPADALDRWAADHARQA